MTPRGTSTNGGAGDATGAGEAKGRRTAVVFVNGEYEDDEFYRRLWAAADLTIAADGGARFLVRAGLTPDLIVGDFDSLGADELDALAAAGARVARHPVRKDFTDAEAAVGAALAEGAGEVVLAGALGGGLDHVLGNLAVLRGAARRGVAARLAAPHLSIAVLAQPGRLAVPAPAQTRVSVVALSDEAIVTLTGLDYPLVRGLLRSDGCLGLGNAVIDSPAAVELHGGEVAVLVCAPLAGW